MWHVCVRAVWRTCVRAACGLYAGFTEVVQSGPKGDGPRAQPSKHAAPASEGGATVVRGEDEKEEREGREESRRAGERRER